MQLPQTTGAAFLPHNVRRRIGLAALATGLLASACASSSGDANGTEPESSNITGDWSAPLATIDNRDESPNSEAWATEMLFAFDLEGAESIAKLLLSDDEADRADVAGAAATVTGDVDFDDSFVALISTFACQPISFELAADADTPGSLVLTKRLEPVDCAWSPDWGSVFVIPRRLDLGDGKVAMFAPGDLPDVSIEQIEVE